MWVGLGRNSSCLLHLTLAGGSLKAVGWNHLMAHSLPHLVTDAGCPLRPQLGLVKEVTICGLFVCPLLLYKMVAEFQGQISRERESIRRKLYDFLRSSSKNPQHYFSCILFAEAVTSPIPGEKKYSFSVDEQWQISRKSYGKYWCGLF